VLLFEVDLHNLASHSAYNGYRGKWRDGPDLTQVACQFESHPPRSLYLWGHPKDSRTLSVRGPIDVVVLNCCVTATKETPRASNISTSPNFSPESGVLRYPSQIFAVDGYGSLPAIIFSLNPRPFWTRGRAGSVAAGGFSQLAWQIPSFARVVRLRCKTHIFETDLLTLAFALSQAYLVECKGNRLSRQASRNAMVGYEKLHHPAAG
jgi:hypothetical protein